MQLIDTIEPEQENNPEALYFGKEYTEAFVEQLKEMLSPFENHVLYLHLMGTDYKKIAEILEKSPKSIDNAIQRIRGKAEKMIPPGGLVAETLRTYDEKIKGDRTMKKGANYGIAALVFIITMILINGAGVVLAAGTGRYSEYIIDGSAGVNMVDGFLMNHLNLYSCLMYVIPGVVFLLWYYFAFIEPVGVNEFGKRQTRRLSPSCFIWLVVLAFAIQHAISLLMALISALMQSAMEEYTELVESSGMTQYSPVWVIATLVLPPLVEETNFPGADPSVFKRAGACFIAANLIQALLFGIFHMNLVQGIYTAIFGFLLDIWHGVTTAFLYLWLCMRYLISSVLAVVELENAVLPDFLLGLILL